MNHRPHYIGRTTGLRILLVLLFSLWLRPALAFVPPNVSFLDLSSQSDLIVVGVMSKIQDSKAAFNVEQVLKGELATPVVEVSPVIAGPRAMGGRRFQEGEMLVLFLKQGSPMTIMTEGWGALTMTPETKDDTIKAVQHLLTLPPPSDTTALTKEMLTLATSDNTLLRREAHSYIIRHLGKREQALQFEDELVALLNHPAPDVRRATLQGIEHLRFEKALPLIIEISRSEDLMLVQAASMALAAYDTPESVAALIALTRHPNPDVRIRSLIDLDDSRQPEAQAALINLLDDPDPKVRAFAPRGLLILLRRGQAFEVLPRLIATLDDPSTEAQVRAADALGESGSVTAIKPLLAVLGREKLSEEAERAAMKSLYIIYSRLDAASRPPVGQNLNLVVAVMERGRWVAGLEAAGFLAQIATPEALAALHRAAQSHRLPEIRDYAQRLLAIEAAKAVHQQ